jgi:hypothetical protein
MAEPVERSIGDVMTDVAGNVERLVRTEVRLTKATLLEGVKGMARGTTLVASGALLGTLAVMFLLLAAVSRLSETMKAWQAALLVAGGTAIISALVISAGLGALRRNAGHFDP